MSEERKSPRSFITTRRAADFQMWWTHMTEFHLIFKLSPLLMGLLSGGGVTQIFSDLEEKTKQYFKLEIEKTLEE